MNTKFLTGAPLLLATVLSASASEVTAPPYRITNPADRVTCLSPGLATSPVTTCVIETDAGLVVIDTGLSPSMAQRTRARINSELGRDDVRWVINTHSHFDHSGGNQVYADALIIGHENAPAAMQAFYDGRETWIARRHGWLARQEAAVAASPEDPNAAAAFEESLHFNQEMIADLQEGYRSTPPALTFADQLTVNAGDLGINLVYFGRAHTDSDILILVPGLKVVFTGDLFHDEVLGTSSFSRPFEVERWLEALDLVLAENSAVDVFIGGHGLLFSREWIEAQRSYLGEVWQAIAEAKASGTNFADFSAALQFDDRFSDIADQLGLPAEDLAEQHTGVLQSLWRVDQISAAEEIGRVARSSGADAARKVWAELRTDDSIYIDEAELNALGYQLLRADRKVAEALAVFEMNTQAFPASWNVWDSFAEAHWWIDDEEGVERNYRKALELNPDAESALRGISQIEGHRLDRAGETREILKFAAGDSTGLDGPYFDQKPPTTTPEVFAPGIVSTAGGFEFSITFSPDTREIYFTRRVEPDGTNTLMVSRWEEAGWTAPEPATFSAGMQANEPHITPDGGRLYFGSRPPEGPPPGIWVAEREGSRWGEPRFHGRGMFASSSSDGDLFMFSPADGGGIVRYPREAEGWGPPERLGGGVNEPRPGVHGQVSPDGSFIVFDSYQRAGAQGGEGDLFVVFRAEEGGWGEAHNLGDTVNTPATNFCPALSPDGKYLFFATKEDIYWVSAEVIHRLRPE